MEAMIFQQALDYLADHVGDMVSPGSPVFDAQSGNWRVAVLCRTAKGLLPVGEIVMDTSGAFLSVPGSDEMLRVLNSM